MARSFPLVLGLALLLGACASNIDSSFQEITLKTPGTDQAKCRLSNNTVVWEVRSNETVKVFRNDADLKVNCLASGNREANVIIDRDLNAWALANVVTGIVPGVAYDHFSGGLYTYPDVLTIDMGPMRPYEGPQYERMDSPGHKHARLEDYGPSVSKREGDQYYVRPALQPMDINDIIAASHPLRASSVTPTSSYGGQ